MAVLTDRLLLVVLLFGVLAAPILAAGGGDGIQVDDPDTIVLNSKNWDKIVPREELILVEFYAPWCGHCKALAPEYAKAATILKKNDPSIPIAKLDATESGDIAQKYSVNGYPTLLVFRNGKESKYEGPRKADGIVAYMKKQVGPAAKPLETKAEIEKFITSDPDTGYAVIGFFEAAQSQLRSSFLLASSKLRDKYVFGKVANAALAKEYGLTGDGLIAFRNFDEPRVIYTGSSKTSEVTAWIEQHSVALIGAFTEKNADLYRSRGMPIAKFFTDVDIKSNAKQYKYLGNRLRPAAEEFASKVTTVIARKKDFENDVKDFNLQNEEWGLVIEDKGDKYRYDGKLTAADVQAFYQDFLDGKLQKYVRSEKIQKHEKGSVKTVVGLNFDEVTQDYSKDLLLEFYAPWCGHCKALEPKYNELAQKLSDNDGIVIAKIDATANDFDRKDYEVSGYPTIYFRPAKEGAKPTKYEGGREVSDMLDHIKKKGKNFKAKAGKKAKKEL